MTYRDELKGLLINYDYNERINDLKTAIMYYIQDHTNEAYNRPEIGVVDTYQGIADSLDDIRNEIRYLAQDKVRNQSTIDALETKLNDLNKVYLKSGKIREDNHKVILFKYKGDKVLDTVTLNYLLNKYINEED